MNIKKVNVANCQFPMWGMKITHVYCNAVTAENSSYCKEHHKLCYEKTRFPLLRGNTIQVKIETKPQEPKSKVTLKKMVKEVQKPKTKASLMEAR